MATDERGLGKPKNDAVVWAFDAVRPHAFCKPIEGPIPGHYICEHGGPDEGCDEPATHAIEDGLTWRYCCQHVPVLEGKPVPRTRHRVWVRPIAIRRVWDEYQAQHFIRIDLRWPTYRSRA